MRPLQLSVTADFACPWCWIGHRHLQAAVTSAQLDRPIRISYLPFELNPDMPVEGIDRKTYRTAKFGNWAWAQALDADVIAQGKLLGLHFNVEQVRLTPNTRRAHRLMAFAQAFGDAPRVDRLFDSIFAAYFAAGLDIGASDVLEGLAADAGFDAPAVRHFLVGSEGEREVIDAQRSAIAAGVQVVPTIRLGNRYISGTQPAKFLAQALRSAALATE